ncbi:MAG TPA: hypothetical protein VFZ66_28345 [Herpetosiphonaceae bacterium]
MYPTRAGNGDMPVGRMEGAHGGTPKLDQAVERGVDQLLAVVDRAVERIGDERERNLVREGVTTIVRQTLYELAEQETRRQMALATMNGGMAVGDTAQAGINVAKQVQNLGFVEFTAGLINSTFDAIIGATLKQMEAYAKLVADLAKTLKEFQAENVSDAQINAHLAQRYPDGEGGTSVRADFIFKDTPDPNNPSGPPLKTANANLKEVADAIKRETTKASPPLDLTIDEAATSFTAEQVTAIQAALGQSLASTMQEQLRAMAREGMARIVITNGEILTRLTFKVTSTEAQTRQATRYHQDSLKVGVRGKAGWGWGSISASVDYSQINVSTVNESSFDSLTMSTEIIGQVKINFKTETFPPLTTEGT